MKNNGKNLKSIKELKNMAENYGVVDNPLFETTLDRYETQICILEELKKAISENDVLVVKEYVKGRGNYYEHPSITAFNRTTDSANKTVSTLLRILKGFKEDNGNNELDPLFDQINGDGANE